MPFVHTLTATPPERYDSEPWTEARIEESPDNVVFTEVEVIALSPLDADPTDPAQRYLTTTAATLESGYFRVVWLDAAANTSPPSASTFSPGAGDDGYPTLDDLLAASGGPAGDALDALKGAQQAALRAEAIAAVEAYANQSFPAEGTEGDPLTLTLDGTGNRTLYLPRRLEQLVALQIDGNAPDLADVTLSAKGDRLSLAGTPGGDSWAMREVARIEGARERVFTSGPDTIEVSGIWGWSELPGAVATALRFHMEDRALGDSHKLAETVRAAGALGLSDVRQGNVSMTLGPEPQLSARARRELADLVWAGAIAQTA